MARQVGVCGAAVDDRPFAGLEGTRATDGVRTHLHLVDVDCEPAARIGHRCVLHRLLMQTSIHFAEHDRSKETRRIGKRVNGQKQKVRTTHPPLRAKHIVKSLFCSAPALTSWGTNVSCVLAKPIIPLLIWLVKRPVSWV